MNPAEYIVVGKAHFDRAVLKSLSKEEAVKFFAHIRKETVLEAHKQANAKADKKTK